MKQIIFNCETITPLFLAGADGKTPELRPPSIKGALRFWWRAMNSELDLKTLLKCEEEIFGGTQLIGLRSPLLIAVTQPEFNPIPAKEFRSSDGLAYLYYSMIHFNDGRSSIPPNTTFSVTLKAPNEEKLKIGISCFWLLTFLGGIGSRSRRGAGNFYVKAIQDPLKIMNNLSPNFIVGNNEDVSTFWQGNFTKVKNILKVNNAGTSLNKYSNISASDLYISANETSDWESALNEIGSIFKNFRLTNQNTAQLQWFESAAFGLPVKHRHGNFTVTPLEEERRASPIIIKVIRFKEKYQWLVLHMDGPFLPKNNRGEDIKKDRQYGHANLATINRFMNSLNNVTKIKLR